MLQVLIKPAFGEQMFLRGEFIRQHGNLGELGGVGEAEERRNWSAGLRPGALKSIVQTLRVGDQRPAFRQQVIAAQTFVSAEQLTGVLRHVGQ